MACFCIHSASAVLGNGRPRLTDRALTYRGLRAGRTGPLGSCATTSERGHGNSAGISLRLSGGSQQFVVPPHEEVLSAGTSDSAAPAMAACRHADWDQAHVAGTQTCKVLCTWNDPEAKVDNVSYLQFELGGILLDFSAHMLRFVEMGRVARRAQLEATIQSAGGCSPQRRSKIPVCDHKTASPPSPSSIEFTSDQRRGACLALNLRWSY